MLLVKLTTLRKLDASVMKRIAAAICLTGACFITNAQDNSPYSRYGLGDEISSSSATSRGMGGVSAAYNSYSSVNYANPASYSFFLSIPEPGTRKQLQGRAILDIGIEGTGHTLIDQSKQSRFTSSNLIFNRISLGVPLRRNWGMAFGLRPLNRISYKMQQSGRLKDENTGVDIDSAITVFEGSGGAYLASLGTGVKFALAKSHYLSLGVNGGYLFGSKDYARHRSFFNDTTLYRTGTWDTKTSMGGLYADAGLQYQGKMSDKLYLGIGVFGNWQQKINTHTTLTSSSIDNSTGVPDTAYTSGEQTGNIIYPTNLTAGFILQKAQSQTEAGWLFGADFTTTNWQNYRENNLPDTAVASNWKLKVGAEFSPVNKKNYLSQMYYRVGFFTGPDYIKLRGKQLPLYGITAGVGLPLANYNQQARGQATIINLGLEYMKRGNNDSPLQENMYRITVGFSLTDMWFGKRRNGDR
ncbi:hypothetical protein SAMN04487894_10444 [Niabella drilacis]|uniref:Long-chain fatty acid transport protein n=2 Tax=Niabella drilacis (strain DSM 25811 / CCM 8410 / CCUG 62505 / LMG 26954 / E90) TaxID=1285928 RepID=A0A1G6PJQ4_NIADE|nr:hypothetical protein SAMN04487894_10444 [Niabella drilacis]